MMIILLTDDRFDAIKTASHRPTGRPTNDVLGLATWPPWQRGGFNVIGQCTIQLLEDRPTQISGKIS